MKKLIFIMLVLGSVFITKAQEFGVGLHAGYLTEIDAVGFGADLVYDINDTWGVASNATIAFTDIAEDKLNWFIVDLNAHYTFYDQLYALAGVEYLNSTFTDRSNVGGFNLGETKITNSDFGGNIGAGYRLNIADNVNVFTEVKYVVLEEGYVHARVGLHFGL